MGFALSKRSLDAMKGVHPDLVRVVRRAIEISPVDFRVIEGLRTEARLRQLVAKGASQTMNSRHLTGHAVDIVPLNDAGQMSGVWPLYYPLAKAIKQAAKELGVPIEWGGDWKRFKDGPHWQLPWGKYPKGAHVQLAAEVTEQKPITNKTEARVATENAVGAASGVGAAVAVGKAPVEALAAAVADQQAGLSSGDWVQIAISGLILALTIYALVKRS